MKTTYDSLAGPVDIEGKETYHDEAFGYTLFEEVIDPANPEGPNAIVMRVPANSLSKVWELVEPGYSERVELLDGNASLVIIPAGTDECTTIPLDEGNPTGDDIEIVCGDKFCVVTGEKEALILSRPSKKFELHFEEGKTKTPADALSQFVLAHVASIEN